MAASGRPKRSKGKDQRRFIANVRQHGPETAEEEILRQYGDGESISKQSVLALKIAFDDIREKYLKSQAENNVLREKLTMGFKAFDDKYKETEKLKQELDFKEKEITDKNTDGTSYQDTNEESEDSTSTITKESVDLEQTHDANKSFRTISTQTDEEKTDEVALPCTDYQKLLKSCGLEVILQDDKAILMLTNRDDLKLWLENETDGKVSVAFEQTPMCERSIQTDDNYTSADVNPGQEVMINKLRSKIYEQANVINKYRQTMEQMMQNKVPMAKEETSKSAEKKIIHVFKNYHQTVLIRSQVAVNHIMSLKKELEFQQNYCKHLLQAIKDTRVRKEFLLSISNVSQPKLHGGLREIKKPPESPSAEGHSDENLSYDERLDEITTSGHMSMPVQESDKQLDSNEGGPTNTEEESSASVITLPESRSSSSEKSGLPPNQSKGHASASSGSVVTKTSAAAAKLSKTRSSGSERFPVPSPRRKTYRSLSPPGTVVVQSGSQDDDFEVINEDYLAVGDTSGISIRAKECPVCFMSYSPASSQEEFEAHVSAHFLD